MKNRNARKTSRKVIIVTGTPGTGKTAFSLKLAKEIGADYVSVTRYVVSHRFYAGFDRERASKIVDLARTQTSLRRLISQATKPVVVDTHIPEGIIPEKTVKSVFVLRCHPKLLETRLRKKKWKPSKTRENVLAEILDSCWTSAIKYYGIKRVVQIDTSRASVRQCVAYAKRTLISKRLPRNMRIDWISTLDKEHSLDRYLE